MKVWVCRSLLGLALMLALIALLSGVGVTMFRSTPAWYAAAECRAGGAAAAVGAGGGE